MARAALSAWRPVGSPGEPYPTWLRALTSQSGAYAIRDRRTKRVLYVGESHTGRLRKTITRHLQEWTRRKRFWASVYSPNEPGTIYRRASVDIAIAVTSADEARATQDALIIRLRPRDNVVGAPETQAGPSVKRGPPLNSVEGLADLINDIWGPLD